MIVIVTMVRMMMTIIPLQEVQPSWSVFSAPRVREAGVQAAVWGLCQGLKVCRNKSWLLKIHFYLIPFFLLQLSIVKMPSLSDDGTDFFILFFSRISSAWHKKKIKKLSWVKFILESVRGPCQTKVHWHGLDKNIIMDLTWLSPSKIDIFLDDLQHYSRDFFLLILLFEVRSKDPVKHSKSVVWKGVFRLIWTDRKIAFLPNTIKTLEP